MLNAKKRFIKLILLVTCLTFVICLAGCQKENKPDVTTKKLTITVINISDVDAGMFSMINPIIKEQMDIGAVNSGESITIEMDWPFIEKEIKWALYNKKGELCIDASTDITEAKDKVTLVMSGEGTIDNIEAKF